MYLTGGWSRSREDTFVLRGWLRPCLPEGILGSFRVGRGGSAVVQFGGLIGALLACSFPVYPAAKVGRNCFNLNDYERNKELRLNLHCSIRIAWERHGLTDSTHLFGIHLALNSPFVASHNF